MKIKFLTGKLVGGTLLVVAVAAVIYFRPKQEEQPPDTSVRPLKSVVVGAQFKDANLYFPGIVSADSQVSLSFNVPGQIIFKPHNRGAEVKKGEVLARLDDSSFQDEVKNAQAEVTRAEATMNRMAKALETNAISKEQFSRAKADYDKAVAQLGIKQKALDDTVIKARFDGVISDIFVDVYDTLRAGQPVISLQDNTLVNIDVAVSEQYVIRKKDDIDKLAKYYAVFDALPDEQFAIKVKEYSTTADPQTQTYTVSFQMDKQEKYNFFSGMSATVVVHDFFKKALANESSIALESDYIGIDSDGSHFVWVLEKTEAEKVFTAVKRQVKVGRRSGTTLEILEGLKEGERIAAAGISVLTPGRRVTLLTPEASKEG
ncbi:MAG: efflux RND transporter periplasmic adaptor subunit [Kiritimatiellae bacterium]|nr:efflux RND transporter periplasmic adaptor subunit [Kiritimatiellia bacterium]